MKQYYHKIKSLETKGSNIQYGNENVTQLEHALQCAELVEKNNFSKNYNSDTIMILPFYMMAKDINEGKDGYHENLSNIYHLLWRRSTRPIRVTLLVKDIYQQLKWYYEILSEASKISLEAQGGPFTKEEAEEFIKKPFMKEAVELRRFDDQAKVLNKETPSLEHFKNYLEESLKN